MPLRGWLTLLPSMLLAWSVGVHGLPGTKALAARDEPAPTILYRGDSRSPDKILKAGGFLPRGSALNEDAGFSVYLHMRGSSSSGGGAPVNSAYVSTSSESNVAVRSLGQNSGYIYEIHPTENIFSVQDTLKNHYLYLDQKEWVALGGIRPDQIKAVAYVAKPSTAAVGKNSPELKFNKFREYNEAKYTGHAASGPQPELAGFPADHPALEEPRWKALSGKPLREPGLELLNRARAAGWEPPSAALKGKGEPGPGPPKNREPKEGVAAAKKELTAVVEEVSAKEFAQLSKKYKLHKVVETKFNQPLPSFRTDKLKYQPFTPGARPPGRPPSSGLKALKSAAGTSPSILGAGSYIHGLIAAFTNDARAVDRVAAVASIVPLVGCATSLAADLSNDDKVNGLEIIGAALCVLGDILLFIPLAPLGVAVQIVRFIMGLIEAFSNPSRPSPKLLKQVKDARDGPWQKFLQDHMYQTLSSKEFGARLGSSLAVESLAFLSEGAQTIGVFEASQEQALNFTEDATEQAQLREFFQNATQNIRRMLSVEIVDKQRQVLLDLVSNVRDQHREASIRALADQYNEGFIKEKLADADEEVKKYIWDEKPPLPDRFAIAYLIGQSTGQDAELPTLSPSDVENALSSSDEPTKALAPLKANDNVDWEIHPLTLSLTDYLQKRQEGITKEDADAISIQQTHAVMQFLEGKIGSDEIAKASPELNPSNAQEFQLLLTMKMGRRLKYWKRSEDGNLHFFPEAAANDPATTIASVLGLEQQRVKAFLGEWTKGVQECLRSGPGSPKCGRP